MTLGFSVAAAEADGHAAICTAPASRANSFACIPVRNRVLRLGGFKGGRGLNSGLAVVESSQCALKSPFDLRGLRVEAPLLRRHPPPPRCAADQPAGSSRRDAAA